MCTFSFVEPSSALPPSSVMAVDVCRNTDSGSAVLSVSTAAGIDAVSGEYVNTNGIQSGPVTLDGGNDPNDEIDGKACGMAVFGKIRLLWTVGK